MNGKITKLKADYANAKKMLDEALQSEDSDPNRILDLQQAKNYRAIQLADYILFNFDDVNDRGRKGRDRS